MPGRQGVAFVTRPPPDHAGNSLARARDVGTLNPGGRARSFGDYVGREDTQDYYKFRVASALQLRARLTGLAANADLQLLDGSGRALRTSAHGGRASEAITRELAAGTYYLRVARAGSASTTYRLTLTPTAPPPPPDPKPTPTTFSYQGVATTSVSLIDPLTFQPYDGAQATYTVDTSVLIRRPLSTANSSQVEDNPFNLLIFPTQPSTGARIRGEVNLSSAEVNLAGSLTRELLLQYWTLERTADGFVGILSNNHSREAANSQTITSPAFIVPSRPSAGIITAPYTLYDGRFGTQFQTVLVATMSDENLRIRVVGYGVSGSNLAAFDSTIDVDLIASE